MALSKPENSSFRDSITTVDSDGKRRWIYPKQPSGNYYNWRSYVSYFLLLVLFGLPFVKVNGEPFILLNIIDRHFILFGLAFTPQDFHLFAILMITLVIFIALFTVVFGRLFCGWVCPQTIFMEMVFRKIEYWIEGDANAQKKLDKAPWNAEKIRKRATKQILFIAVSAIIAHTFLAYIIGIDRLWALVSQSPLEAPGGFIAILVFIAVFYFVFSYMREQVCIAICPYGRLQGVLLDNNSINVIYDYNRGEPRGKIRKNKQKSKSKNSNCSSCSNCKNGSHSCASKMLERIDENIVAAEKPMIATSLVNHETVLGDCIDCKLCVQVCPTGIDIRNGIQMECINCTACMDACDEVMLKIGREPALIRYDSEDGVSRSKRKIWTTRVVAYSVVLLLLVALNVFLLSGRTQLDALLLRAQGQLAETMPNGQVKNLYTFQLVNKSRSDLPVRFEVVNVAEAEISFIGGDPIASSSKVTEGALFVTLPPKGATKKLDLEIVVWSGDRKLDELSTVFIYPKK